MTGNNNIRRTGGDAPGTDGREYRGREICLSLLREAPDGFVLVDSEGRCRCLNRAFTRITGYTGDDLPTVAAWFERAHPNPAYRRGVQEMWQELLQGDRSVVVAGVVCRDGKVRDIEIRQTPVEGGCSLYVVRDVTEQVATEEHLRLATSELTAVIEAFPDLFLRLNADGTIIESRAGRLVEVPLVPRALLGRRVQDLLPADLGETVGNALQQAVRTGVPSAPLEFSHQVDGEVRHYEARIVPLYEMHVMAVIRDITERKRAEQELHRHREHLEDLVAGRTAELERANQQLQRLLYYIEMTERRAAEEWLDLSAGQGSLGTAEPEEGRITTDAAGTVVIVNRAAERLTGYAGGDLTGRPVWPLLSITGTDGDAREILSRELLEQGRAVQRAEGMVLVRSDGTEVSIRFSGDPIIDADGAVIGMVCTFQRV